MRSSCAIAPRRSSSCTITAYAANTPPYFRRQGFRNLYKLSGDIDVWSALMDPSVPRY